MKYTKNAGCAASGCAASGCAAFLSGILKMPARKPAGCAASGCAAFLSGILKMPARKPTGCAASGCAAFLSGILKMPARKPAHPVTAHLTFILAIAIMLFCIPAAYAEPEDESDFTMSVPGVRSLTIDPDSLRFDPDLDQITRGYTDEEVVIATVSANVGWVLTITGSAQVWEGPWQKPVGDIYWKYGGGEAGSIGTDSGVAGYQSLTTLSAVVVSGGPCNQHTYPISFGVKLDIEKDVPGEYYYAYIVFELTTP